MQDRETEANLADLAAKFPADPLAKLWSEIGRARAVGLAGAEPWVVVDVSVARAVADELLAYRTAALENIAAYLAPLIAAAGDCPGCPPNVVTLTFPASPGCCCERCGDKLNHDDDGPRFCRFCENSTTADGPAEAGH
jgi:hypothetical protein